VVAPLQPLVHEDLADATAFDRDALRLAEVGLQAIERPAPEGQAQALRVGQRRGDDLGALLGRISRRTPGPGPILRPVEALVIEAMNPGVDRRPGDAEVLGDLAGTSSGGEGQEDLSPLDESGLGGA
jgi:hypothetical protein